MVFKVRASAVTGLLFSHWVLSSSLQLHRLTAAHQVSLSFTISWSSLKLMYIESVMLSMIVDFILSALWQIRITGDGSWRKFCQKVVHWRREWQTTSVSLPWEPHEQYETANDRILKEELPSLVGAQYAARDQWRNNSRKNEGMEPKQKQYPVVDVTGDRTKVQCCKVQYCIRTWNVRSICCCCC